MSLTIASETPVSISPTDDKPLLRVALPPLAWYGGSWAYEEPDPEPPAPVKPPEEKPPARDYSKNPADFGPEKPPGSGRGVIFGRFLPPHAGHQYLVEFARSFTPHLTLFLRVGPQDEIAGEQREAWLREIFADTKVVRVDDGATATDGPPDDKVWTRWAELVAKHIGTPDYLFASESYGPSLAARLNARYVPIDAARHIVPVSGTQIRANPAAFWEYLPECVRGHYVRRVCLIGPESTGKSTLAWRLAAHFNTLCTEEYARTLSLNTHNFVWADADTQIIAQGQRATTNALARRAYRVLFCDTDLLAVRLWSERLFGASPDWLREATQQPDTHFYLLLRPDVPFTGPAQFDQPQARQDFYERCRAVLTASGVPFAEIGGDWDARFSQACATVNALLTSQ